MGKENWVDIANKKKDGSYPNVEEAVERKEKIILNVCQLQKQEECQRTKEQVLLQENKLSSIQDLNHQELATFAKRKKAGWWLHG